MQNRHSGRIVMLKAGAKVRVWSDEDQMVNSFVMPEEESWRPHRVLEAIACPTIHGGGSNLVLAEIDDKGRDLGFGYRVWCHSSQLQGS